MEGSNLPGKSACTNSRGTSGPLGELERPKEPPALLRPDMALERRKRIDGPFAAPRDEQTRSEASDDTVALEARTVASPGKDGPAELWLESDHAGCGHQQRATDRFSSSFREFASNHWPSAGTGGFAR